MLIVGEKEEAENTVSVRKQSEGGQGTCSVEAFAATINDEIKKLLEE